MKLFSFLIALFSITSVFSQGDLEDGLYAKFNTDKGEILIMLNHEKVPMTVANFVGLAEGKLSYNEIEIKEPFFDSLKFRRVIANFMIQGGDPNGNGSGNPGYSFPDEFDSTLVHDRAGILSMANSGPNTNGSQFFITHKETPWLNNKHTVFGHVVKGQDVVDKIEQDEYILSVEIIRQGKGAKKFKAHKVFPKAVENIEIKAKEELVERSQKCLEEVAPIYPNAQLTDSGLMYEILEKGNGETIETGDTVTVHYKGTFLNGKKFDASYDRDKPYTIIIDKSRVIKGWHDGMKYGQEGGKIRLVIPHWLAYGPNGRSSIPPYSTLVFDLEILEVGKAAKKKK